MTKLTVRLPAPVNLGELVRKHGYKPTGKIGLPFSRDFEPCAEPEEVQKRPDHVKCAQMDLWDGGDPPKPTHKTWCGRIISPHMEWQFKDASHALLNGLNSGRGLLCAECAAAIKDALRAVSYRPERQKRP